MNTIEPDEYGDHEKVIPRSLPDQGALQAEVESLQQQLAFAESIHKVAVQQRDTAWAALNDREKHIDRLKAALAERHREVLTWERRYRDLIAEYSNAVALRPPPPIIINAPTRKPPTDEELAPIVRDYDALLSEREQMMAQHREDVDKLNDAVVAWKTECERLTARLRQEEDEHVRTAAMCRTASNERDALRAELNLALDRITDTLYEGDDGRGWREAEKFLKRHRPQEGTL